MHIFLSIEPHFQKKSWEIISAKPDIYLIFTTKTIRKKRELDKNDTKNRNNVHCLYIINKFLHLKGQWDSVKI